MTNFSIILFKISNKEINKIKQKLILFISQDLCDLVINFIQDSEKVYINTQKFSFAERIKINCCSFGIYKNKVVYMGTWLGEIIEMHTIKDNLLHKLSTNDKFVFDTYLINTLLTLHKQEIISEQGESIFTYKYINSKNISLICNIDTEYEKKYFEKNDNHFLRGNSYNDYLVTIVDEYRFLRIIDFLKLYFKKRKSFYNCNLL
jgi:hypothetical protein